MTQKGQPFFFDSNVFDPDDPRYTEIDKKKPKLEYTQEQLAHAKESAFESGKIAGYKESQASLMQDVQKILQKTERELSALQAKEKERNQLFEVEAVHLTLQIFSRIFKVYAEKVGTEELKNIITQILTEHREENIIALDVHPSQFQGLHDFIQQQENEDIKKIMVKSNPALGKLECKLLWNNGGISYDVQKIKDRIEKTLAEALAVYNISVHDQGEMAQSGHTSGDVINE